MVNQEGLDLTGIIPSGKDGRYRKSDIINSKKKSDEKNKVENAHIPRQSYELSGIDLEALKHIIKESVHEQSLNLHLKTEHTEVPTTIIQKAMIESMNESLKIPHLGL